MQIDVRPASRQEWPAAAAVLAEAFDDDPVIRWLSPRQSSDQALFSCLIWSMHYAVVDLAFLDGRPVGAALWDPPGHRVPWWRRMIGVPRFAAVLQHHTVRGLQIEKLYNEAMPDEPFWYLASIGAIYRGRGIGSALIDWRMRQFDGLAYLECSKPENIPLYERFGYRTTGGIQLPNGPCPARMIRTPGDAPA